MAETIEESKAMDSANNVSLSTEKVPGLNVSPGADVIPNGHTDSSKHTSNGADLDAPGLADTKSPNNKYDEVGELSHSCEESEDGNDQTEQNEIGTKEDMEEHSSNVSNTESVHTGEPSEAGRSVDDTESVNHSEVVNDSEHVNDSEPVNDSETVDNLEAVNNSEPVDNSAVNDSKTVDNSAVNDLETVNDSEAVNDLETVDNSAVNDSKTVENSAVNDSETVDNSAVNDSKTVDISAVNDSETVDDSEVENSSLSAPVVEDVKEENGSEAFEADASNTRTEQHISANVAGDESISESQEIKTTEGQLLIENKTHNESFSPDENGGPEVNTSAGDADQLLEDQDKSQSDLMEDRNQSEVLKSEHVQENIGDSEHDPKPHDDSLSIRENRESEVKISAGDADQLIEDKDKNHSVLMEDKNQSDVLESEPVHETVGDFEHEPSASTLDTASKEEVCVAVNEAVEKVEPKTSKEDDLLPVPDGQPLDLLLIGRTGHGKTSICKTILESTDTMAKCTTECFLIETTVGRRLLRLLDTPGTIDSKKGGVALKEVANIFTLNPSGFHAILFVIKYGSKMSDDELSLSEMLKVLLGEDVFRNYVMLVVTHGDIFESDTEKGLVAGDIKSYVDQHDGRLKDLLTECKYRMILFDNTDVDPAKKRKQVCELVSMVDEIVNSNDGKRYDSSYFKLAKKETEFQTSTTLTGTETDEERRALEEGIKGQVGQVVAEQIKKDNNWCFPADALVRLSSRQHVAMASLRVGDKVLSCAHDGRLVYSEVYMFGHLESDVMLPCIKIRTSDFSISLSPGHYILVGDEPAASMTPVLAQNVKCGDSVYVYRSSHKVEPRSAELEPSTVIEVQTTVCRGKYAPFTECGTIVVDDILASCYVEILPPYISHLLLWPIRKLYAVFPGLCSTLTYSRFCGIPLWVHWCMKTVLPRLPLIFGDRLTK